MTDEQSAYFDMCQAVLTYFAQNPTVPTAPPAMVVAHARFLVLMDDWQNALEAQDTNATGQALSTDNAKKNAARLIQPIADALAALGDATGDDVLEDEATTSFTELDELSHGGFGGRIQDILDLAADDENSEIFTEYGVTAAKVTAATAAFAQYRSRRGAARYAESEGTAGTKAIARINEELRQLLNDRIDRLMSIATGGDEMLMDQWATVREIVDGPTQTRALTVTVRTQAGEPVSGAAVVIDPGGLQKTTGPEGIFYVQSMAPGSYQLSVSKPGYVTVSGQEFVVSTGEMANVEVVMNAAGGGGTQD